MVADYLVAIFLLSVLVQLMYWLFLFSRLKSDAGADSLPIPHDIVVCYKNEEARLPRLIKHLATQGCEQCVLVDDFSTDGSADIVAQAQSANVVAAQAGVDRSGKKAALLAGLQAASAGVVVLTDADCRPATADWSKIMSSHLTGADAVLGYAPMQPQRGMVPTFARYETYLTAIQYLSYAQAGFAYMGVGRNMAVCRATALPVLEQMQHDQLASGDDDLLVQGLSGHGSIKTCLDPRSFVYSESPLDLGSYVRQKARHMSTATSYRFVHQVLLAVFAASHLLTYTLGSLLLVLFPATAPQVVAVLSVKWTLQMTVNKKLMYLLDEKDLWWKFPILDIATFAFYLVMTPYMFLKNKTLWS